MQALAPDTQAALLLTARLGGSDPKPLSLVEYNVLARQLVERQTRPGDLLTGPIEGFAVGTERLQRLLSRGAALAIAVERWSQSGIRPIGRGDPDYPVGLRAKLRSQAAPVVFVCGSLEVLGSDALCIVGSRDATSEGLLFASRLGGACAQEGISVVSGDARGVDREAMHSCLAKGGLAVGVLAESMSAAVLIRRNRDPILAGRLLLLSPFDPEARFTVSHAMERNRYLYTLAEAAVVVDSDLKGGTWSGVLENQKNKWTQAFVRIGGEVGAGNARLAELGVEALSNDQGIISVRALLDKARKPMGDSSSGQLSLQPVVNDARGPEWRGSVQDTDAEALFTLWATRLVRGTVGEPITLDDTISRFALQPEQAQAWLQRAVDEGLITLGLERNIYVVSKTLGLEQKREVMLSETAHTTEFPEQSIISVEAAVS